MSSRYSSYSIKVNSNSRLILIPNIHVSRDVCLAIINVEYVSHRVTALSTLWLDVKQWRWLKALGVYKQSHSTGTANLKECLPHISWVQVVWFPLLNLVLSKGDCTLHTAHCTINSPSTHQSQGNREETQDVQELYVLQSKKVKLVATKSGPFSTLTDSLDVKWDSPLGIRGSKSFLKHKIFNLNST